MKNQYILGKSDSGMHYIMLDQETLDKFSKSGNKRVLCKLNDQIEFHCAIISKKEGGSFIYVGSKIRKELMIKATPTEFKTPTELNPVEVSFSKF